MSETLQPLPFPIRTECPPGACVCEREQLLGAPGADLRVLRLTRQEETRLIERIDRIASYAELKHLQSLLDKQLGIVLRITPGIHEVRSARGILIVLEERPGLCKKIRQSVPAAIRRAFERHPGIMYEILDANGLFGGG